MLVVCCLMIQCASVSIMSHADCPLGFSIDPPATAADFGLPVLMLPGFCDVKLDGSRGSPRPSLVKSCQHFGLL